MNETQRIEKAKQSWQQNEKKQNLISGLINIIPQMSMFSIVNVGNKIKLVTR